MLIRDFIEVPLPFETVVEAFSDPARWARALDGEIAPYERTLLARFGVDGVFAPFGKRVEVRIGAPRRQSRGTVVDIQWQVAGGTGWFPVMAADVLISALDALTTHVEFSGSYTPPGSTPGRVADRLMLYRVAEHAVRLLLTLLVEELKGVSA